VVKHGAAQQRKDRVRVVQRRVLRTQPGLLSDSALCVRSIIVPHLIWRAYDRCDHKLKGAKPCLPIAKM